MMKKRILAMVMAMVMCLSLLPVSALATEGKPDTTPEIPKETCTVDYTKKQSEGVTYTGYTGSQKDGYVFTYEIGENAPEEIVIDLAECAKSWWEKETQMPGGKYNFSIQIINNSGRVYEYKDNSFVLAPGHTADFGSLEEGSLLPVLTYDGQYLPLKFSGSMLPQCFKDLYDESNPYAPTSFEQLCKIYETLESKGYSSISDYLLNVYFAEKFEYRKGEYASLSEMVAKNPTRLDRMFNTTGYNGIYTMSKLELEEYIANYPWIDRFCHVTNTADPENWQVQIKWPEGDVAALSYNSFYQSIFSVVYGKENADRLDPRDGVDFSRAHAVGDYMPGTQLYKETENYFQGLTKKGLKPGKTMTIDAAWGLDGPGMGNSYANYSFTYHNMIELKEKEPEAWDTSKSKTATNLDKNYESDVTLSLPSAQEELVTDVVFVLDESSCSEPVKQEVSKMLGDLYTQIENTGASIKIGAVQFRGEVTKLPLTELTDATKDSVTTFMATRPETGGSNMSAGLLAGEKMLDADTSVDNNRKYLILVSDGITYIWDNETTEVQENIGVNFANSDTPNAPMLASPDGWDVKHGRGYVPTDWKTELETIYSFMANTIKEKSSTYVRGSDISDNPFVAYSEKGDYASTVDIALYKSYEAYQRIASKYNAYVVVSGVEDEMNAYPFGPSFMNYLADKKSVSFEDIQNDIYYLLSAGSKVEDYIGYVENDYNFDFVNDASKLTIQVGDTIYKAEKINENQYGFHQHVAPISESSNEAVANTDYDYVLTYVPGNKQDTEHFVWDINVPITNFERVSLTYTVKLTNPKTASGTYGEYDKDGSAEKAALYTNNIATLYPVDSDGDKGLPENFRKPTVSYTVSGGGGGGSTKPPVLNTKDHYGYIIGYPEDYETGEKTSDQTRMPVKPMGNITRAEVATIFFRMLTDESRAEFWSQTSSYSDVEIDDWFNNAICTLSNANIISGYPDGTFKPNGKITRAEFATIASRFFEYADENIDNPFSDVPEDSWYYRFVLAASEMGLINGYPDGTFKPNDPIIRCEACAIMNRTLDRHPDQKHFLKDMLVWVDNMDTGKWYYDDMQEATNSHEYKMNGSGDSKYETWTKMLPIRDWAAFEREWSDANSASGGEVVN